MNFFKCKISRVLVLYVVIFSSFVTLLLTLLQLRIDYNYGVSDIEQRLEIIKITNIDSVTESLWTVDESLLKIQMDGLSRLPDVVYVEIVDEQGGKISSSGELSTTYTIQQSYPLYKTYRNSNIKLGHLRIIATKKNLYKRLLDTVLVILITQAIKTFLVSIFIVVVINYLVTRHLSRIADFLESINVKKKVNEFSLDRDVSRMQKGDELDRVVYSINKMMNDNHLKYLELKESQHKLTQSESRFFAIFNSISDSVVVSDVHGNILLVNPAFNKHFSYTDGVPSDLNELVVYDRESEIDAHIIYKQVIDDSMEKLQEYNFLRSDGTEFSGEIISSKIQHADGEYVAYLSIIRDVTQKKREAIEKQKLMNELQQSQKMESIGLLVGGIAHDFNNILGSIIGYSELAFELVAEDQSQLRKYLSRVIVSSERASSLIKQLLAFSRRGSSELERLEIHKLIIELTDMIKPLLPATIDFKVNVQPDIPDVIFDSTQIQQILLNICLNARDAMKGRGSLDLLISYENVDNVICQSCQKGISGQYVVIRILDTGCGIEEDKLTTIFDPFFTTKDQGEGTGMGLSVVHGILHQHNSHISVESKIGKGTRFTLYLPAVEPGVEFSSEETTNKKIDIDKQDVDRTVSNQQQTILVVDDEDMLVNFLMEYLESYGYKVLSSTDSLKALKLFQKEHKHIDLLITDHTMPNLTGLELIRQIHVYNPELPVILCSGLEDVITNDDREKYKIDYYLQKPVKGPLLIEKVKQLLSEKQL